MEEALTIYGPLGIMVAVLLVVAKQFLDRERQRADDERAEVRRLNGVIQEMVVPMMERSARANEAAMAYLQQQEAERLVRERLRDARHDQ
jgi:hypothetical protein